MNGPTGPSPTARNPATDDLLRRARTGDKEALDALFTLAYDALRGMARRVRGGRDDTLTTTALVHEAYLKLVPSSLPANDAAHFRLLIARVMREVLIDAARRRHADKRGGNDLRISLDENLAAPGKSADLLQLHEALQQLERIDQRRAAVVECRFFGGMDVEETAVALDVSTATVKRDWRVARAWLAQVVS